MCDLASELRQNEVLCEKSQLSQLTLEEYRKRYQHLSARLADKEVELTSLQDIFNTHTSGLDILQNMWNHLNGNLGYFTSKTQDALGVMQNLAKGKNPIQVSHIQAIYEGLRTKYPR